jgi:hypothetical protein
LPSRDVPLAFRALDRIPCGRFLGLWSIFAGFSEFLLAESVVVLSYFVEPANHRKSPKDNPKGFRQKPTKVCKEISEKC